MKKKISIIAIGLFLFTSLLVNFPVRGQTPSPEATPTAEETTDDKIEGIREAVKEKVQERLAEAQKRAFVGEIVDINNSTLTIETHLEEKQATVSEEAIIIDLEKEEIELGDLEIGSFAIAMGYLQETGILDTRRVVIIEEPEFPARLVAFGMVDDISSEGEKILKIKNPKKETICTVEAATKTKITQKIEGKTKTLEFEDIEIGDQLVAIGSPVEDEIDFLTAKLIQIVFGEAVEEEEPTPTPVETSE